MGWLRGTGLGSPPPMRGKECYFIIQRPVPRITPAYAGKSINTKYRQFLLQDHPRLCGEKQLSSLKAVNLIGSPPPMRGKELHGADSTCWIRITPAYAGKSRHLLKSVQMFWDHPRLCGEKLDFIFEYGFHLGSPPPMRGKDISIFIYNRYIRITPAYAGKSPRHIISGGRSWDHPRLCGEKKSFRGKSQSRIGSPPPMRGKARFSKMSASVSRITPAYAGKRQEVNEWKQKI